MAIRAPDGANNNKTWKRRKLPPAWQQYRAGSHLWVAFAQQGPGWLLRCRLLLCTHINEKRSLSNCFWDLDPSQLYNSWAFDAKKKHRKNCECCPGHYLIVTNKPLMSWYKFRNLSVIVNCVDRVPAWLPSASGLGLLTINCVTKSLIHKIALNLNLNRCLCSHCSYDVKSDSVHNAVATC